MVQYPLLFACKIIKLYPKEKYLARTPDYKRLLIYQIHCTQILIINILKIVVFFALIFFIFYFCYGDSEGFSLAVESVDLVVIGVVEAFLRKILIITIHFYLGMPCNGASCFIEKEVVMGDRSIMEKIHKNQVVGDESASDEGVWEVVDRHCVVV